jgi:hypothetical protein
MQFYRDIDPVDDRDFRQQRRDERKRREAAQFRARVRADRDDY